MILTKPNGLTLEELVKSATMFYIDEELEREFSNAVTASVEKIRSNLVGVAMLDGLSKYIKEDKEALHLITSLLNISEEKFKRVVTMLRIQKNYIPTSEWTLLNIRKQMLESADFMQEICELLSNGANLDKYKTKIPAFYLENFNIDTSTLGRLANVDDVRRLVKKGLEGRYSNKIGDSFFKFVSDYITSVCEHEGLTYSVKKDVPLVGRSMSVAIPDVDNPRLLIDIAYLITTSSTQTKDAESAEKAAAIIRKHNSNKEEENHIVFINIVEGAGWIARQSDLRKIERCSDYFLNLKSLDVIKNIINYYFNGGVSQ